MPDMKIKLGMSNSTNVGKLGILGGGVAAADTTAPTVTAFAATTPVIGTTVTITSFTATDAVGVTGYLITESSTPPAAGAAGWTGSAPSSYTVSSGSCTLYPWAKDAAGNVSSVYGSPVAVEIYQTPAYINADGAGDRTLSITITTSLTNVHNNLIANMINGNTTEQTWYFENANAVSGEYIRFQFGGAKIINEAKWYQSQSAAHGTWKWQGSNNGSTWTDIGSSFTWDGAPGGTAITTLSGNVTPYLYYQMVGVSGNANMAPYLQEMEFKIGNLI